MGECDYSFCITLLLIFQLFSFKSRSLWWDGKTLWYQGMFIAGLLARELDSGAVCAVFNVKHRSIKL